MTGPPLAEGGRMDTARHLQAVVSPGACLADDPEDLADPDLACWEKAIRIQVEHPRWVVVWLARLGHYRAYPFFRLRSGAKYVSSSKPDELVALIDEAEQASKLPEGRAQAMRAARR
jgi:hypothetical protein